MNIHISYFIFHKYISIYMLFLKVYTSFISIYLYLSLSLSLSLSFFLSLSLYIYIHIYTYIHIYIDIICRLIAGIQLRQARPRLRRTCSHLQKNSSCLRNRTALSSPRKSSPYTRSRASDAQASLEAVRFESNRIALDALSRVPYSDNEI